MYVGSYIHIKFLMKKHNANKNRQPVLHCDINKLE